MFKTTIIIYHHGPGDDIELSDFAEEVEHGDMYCAEKRSEEVARDELPEAVAAFFFGDDA